MRTDSTGQLLALYGEPPRTFYCGACNRDIRIAYKYTHPSTQTHSNAQRGARPTRTNYVKKLRAERPRKSVFVNDDNALEAYYRQCAIEDGTADAIEREWT